MSLVIIPATKATLPTEENKNNKENTSDIILQSYFENYFPSKNSRVNASESSKEWYWYIIFPWNIIIILLRYLHPPKTLKKEEEEAQQEEEEEEEEEKEETQKRAWTDSSFLRFHLTSKKLNYSYIQDSHYSNCLILDYGKVLFNDDISFTSDYQQLQKNAVSNEAQLIHTRFIQKNGKCYVSWGDLEEVILVYEYSETKQRPSHTNVKWHLIQRILPFDYSQRINNFVSDMSFIQDNLVVSRCNALTELIPCNGQGKGGAIGMDMSRYHQDIISIDTLYSDKCIYLVAAGTSPDHLTLITFYKIHIQDGDVKTMECIHTISFQSRTLSLYNARNILETILPIMQVSFLENKNHVALLDYHGYVTILKLAQSDMSILNTKILPTFSHNRILFFSDYLSISSTSASLDIYDLQYKNILHVNYANHNLILTKPTTQKDISSFFLIQYPNVQVANIQHLTNEEAFELFYNRHDYKAAIELAISHNIHHENLDLCFQNVWEEYTLKKNSIKQLTEILQQYWIPIQDDAFILHTCFNTQSIKLLQNDQENSSIFVTIFQEGLKRFPNNRNLSLLFDKLSCFDSLCHYYHVPFHSKKFHQLPNDVFQKLANSNAIQGDVIALSFMILKYGTYLHSLTSFYEELPLSLNPKLFQYLLPIVMQNEIRFLLEGKIVSPAELYDFFKEHYAHKCDLFQSPINKNTIISISQEEEVKLKSFYQRRIEYLMEYTQHLSFIYESCIIFQTKCQAMKLDTSFFQQKKKLSHSLLTCMRQGIIEVDVTLDQFQQFDTTDFVFKILGVDDSIDSNVVIDRYYDLLLPALNTIHNETKDIQDDIINYIYYRIKENVSRTNRCNALRLLQRFFYFSRTTIPQNAARPRIISSPLKLLASFQKVALLITGTWEKSYVQFDINILWECYECLPIQCNVQDSDELQKIQKDVDNTYNYLIVMDVMSRYDIIPPSLEYLIRFQKKQNTVVQSIVCLLHDSYFHGNSAASFEEFFSDMIQVIFHLSNDPMQSFKRALFFYLLPTLIHLQKWSCITTTIRFINSSNNDEKDVIDFRKTLLKEMEQLITNSFLNILKNLDLSTPELNKLQSTILSAYHELHQFMSGIIPLKNDIVKYLDLCYFLLSEMNIDANSSIKLLPFLTFQSSLKTDEKLSWIQSLITHKVLFRSSFDEKWLHDEIFSKQTCLNLLSFLDSTAKLQNYESSNIVSLWHDFLLPGKFIFPILSFLSIDEKRSSYILAYYIFHSLVQQVKKGVEFISTLTPASCCGAMLLHQLNHDNVEISFLIQLLQDVIALLDFFESCGSKSELQHDYQYSIWKVLGQEGLVLFDKEIPYFLSSLRSMEEFQFFNTGKEKENITNDIFPEDNNTKEQHSESNGTDTNAPPQTSNFLVFQAANLVAKGMTKILATDESMLSANSELPSDKRSAKAINPSFFYPLVFSIRRCISPSDDEIKYHVYDSYEEIDTLLENFLPTLNPANLVLGSDTWTIQLLIAFLLMVQDIDKKRYLANDLQQKITFFQEKMPPHSSVTVRADPSIVQYLVGIGYQRNSALRCALKTNNHSCSMALQYAVAHEKDSDFTYPVVFVAKESEKYNKKMMHGVNLFKFRVGFEIVNECLNDGNNGFVPKSPQSSSMEVQKSEQSNSIEIITKEKSVGEIPSVLVEPQQSKPAPPPPPKVILQKIAPPPPPPITSTALKIPQPIPKPISMSSKASSFLENSSQNSTSHQKPPPVSLPHLRKPKHQIFTPSTHSDEIQSNSTYRKHPPPPTPPPPPIPSTSKLLKIILPSQSKSTSTPVTKSLTPEERKRLAMEGRKLFLTNRNKPNNSKDQEIKQDTKLSSSISNNGLEMRLQRNLPVKPPPPPPPLPPPKLQSVSQSSKTENNSNIEKENGETIATSDMNNELNAGDGWDFDEASLKDEEETSKTMEDGWDFDDF